MKTIPTGSPVKLIQPEIVGIVVGGRLLENGEDVAYRVAYTLPSGEMFEREFTVGQLELLEKEHAEKALNKHAEHMINEKGKRAKEKHISEIHNKKGKP